MEAEISSTANPLFKKWKALVSDGNARREAGLYLVEGVKLCAEALRLGVGVREAIITADFEGPVLQVISSQRLKAHVLNARTFRALSTTETPQGVMLVMELPKPRTGVRISLAVAAENLQDPGNLGTLLRSAWASEADLVLLSEGCADPYAPKTVRSAAGAQLHLNIETRVKLEKRLHALAAQGIVTMALDPKSPNDLWDSNMAPPVCLVVGSEGQGLSEPITAACKERVRLQYPGKAESLNAGVSLSIALFEALRQRRQKK